MSNSVRHIASLRGLDAAIRHGAGRDTGTAPPAGDFAAVMNVAIDEDVGPDSGAPAEPASAGIGNGRRFGAAWVNGSAPAVVAETVTGTTAEPSSGTAIATPIAAISQNWRRGIPVPPPLVAAQAPGESAAATVPGLASAKRLSGPMEQTVPVQSSIVPNLIAAIGGGAVAPQLAVTARRETAAKQGSSHVVSTNDPPQDASATASAASSNAALPVPDASTTSAKVAPVFSHRARPTVPGQMGGAGRIAVAPAVIVERSTPQDQSLALPTSAKGQVSQASLPASRGAEAKRVGSHIASTLGPPQHAPTLVGQTRPDRQESTPNSAAAAPSVEMSLLLAASAAIRAAPPAGSSGGGVAPAVSVERSTPQDQSLVRPTSAREQGSAPGASSWQPRTSGRPDLFPALPAVDTTDSGEAISTVNAPTFTTAADSQDLSPQVPRWPAAGAVATPTAANQSGPAPSTDNDGLAASLAPLPVGPNAAPAGPITPSSSSGGSDGRVGGGFAGAWPPSNATVAASQTAQDSVPEISTTPGVIAVPAPSGNMPASSAPVGAVLHGDRGMIAPGDGPNSFGLAMANHVAAMVTSGHQETTLQLQPPHLGELSVRVAVQGRDVSTWFSAPQPQVQLAVSQALDQLRAGLSGAGLNLAGAWVGADASAMQQRSSDTPPPSARRGAFTPISVTAPATDAADRSRAAGGVSIYV